MNTIRQQTALRSHLVRAAEREHGRKRASYKIFAVCFVCMVVILILNALGVQ